MNAIPIPDSYALDTSILVKVHNCLPTRSTTRMCNLFDVIDCFFLVLYCSQEVIEMNCSFINVLLEL